MGGYRTARLLASLTALGCLAAGCGSGSFHTSSGSTTSTGGGQATTTTTGGSGQTLPGTDDTTTTEAPDTTTSSGSGGGTPPPEPGLPVVGSFAHFAADFPKAPTTNTDSRSADGFQFKIYTAAAKGGNFAVVVGEEDITPDLPSDQVTTALGAALQSAGSNGNLTISSQPTPSTFRGMNADTATYTGASFSAKGLTFIADHNTRLYILLAPTDLYTPFTNSLVLKP